MKEKKWGITFDSFATAHILAVSKGFVSPTRRAKRTSTAHGHARKVQSF